MKFIQCVINMNVLSEMVYFLHAAYSCMKMVYFMHGLVYYKIGVAALYACFVGAFVGLLYCGRAKGPIPNWSTPYSLILRLLIKLPTAW